ncbi:hypothetical protein D1872_281890 [compost metagenome]
MFGGGGLMKGLMIGGIAGLLFGGLFAGMGGLGEILGLAVNLLVIYVIVVAAFALYRNFKNRRKVNDSHQGR